jgi:small subunit ribosomal protein S7
MRGTRSLSRPVLQPDQTYRSLLVTKLTNRLMLRGQKATAEKLVRTAFTQIEADSKQSPLSVFEQALTNVSPLVEVRSKRIGGATYQVPMEVRPTRKEALAMRWIIAASRDRHGKAFAVRLAEELMAAAKGEGSAMRKRDEMHRMAEANKAFAHYARF